MDRSEQGAYDAYLDERGNGIGSIERGLERANVVGRRVDDASGIHLKAWCGQTWPTPFPSNLSRKNCYSVITRLQTNIAGNV